MKRASCPTPRRPSASAGPTEATSLTCTIRSGATGCDNSLRYDPCTSAGRSNQLSVREYMVSHGVNDVVLSEPVAPPSAIRVRKLDRADVRALGDLRGTEVTEGLLATLGDRARLAFFGAALDDRDAFGAIAE